MELQRFTDYTGFAESRHEDFIKRVEKSDITRFRGLKYLQDLHMNAELGASPVINEEEDDGGYIDVGDIFLHLNGLTGRVEVKGNWGYEYHKATDWHTDRIFINDARLAFDSDDKYEYPLCAVMLVDMTNTGLFWVPAYYRPLWYRTEIVVNKKGVRKRYAAMSKDYLWNLFFDMDRVDPIPDKLIHIGYDKALPEMGDE